MRYSNDIGSSLKTDFGDKVLSFLIFFQPILVLLQLIIQEISGSTDLGILLRVTLSGLVTLIAIPYILNRNFILSILIYTLVIVLFLVSIIIAYSNFEYVKNEGIKFVILTNIPILLAGLSIVNIDNLIRILEKCIWVIFILSLVYMVISVSESVYNMSFGYVLLLPVLYGLYSRKKHKLLISLILFVAMFLTGSRGPVVVVLIFFILSKIKDISVAKAIMFLLFSLIVFFLYLYTQLNLQTLFEGVGFQSRTLDLILSGDFLSHDSGRNDLYQLFLSKILDNPFYAHGLYADRVILGGFYTHNLFLEILLNFGAFLGMIIIIALFCRSVVLFLTLNEEARLFLMLVICYSIIQLLVSNSYLISSNFFFFLAMIFRNKHFYNKLNIQYL